MKRSLGVILLLIIGLGVLSFDFASKPQSSTALPPTPSPAQQQVVQEPELEAYFKILGIKNNKIGLVYGDSSDLTGEDASYNNGVITVNPKLSKTEGVQMVGHEYMHYYWREKLSEKIKKSLLDGLDYALNSNPWIPSQLAKPLYNNCNKNCKIEETYAYACTSLHDNSLTPELIKHCNLVLPGRYNITW